MYIQTLAKQIWAQSWLGDWHVLLKIIQFYISKERKTSLVIKMSSMTPKLSPQELKVNLQPPNTAPPSPCPPCSHVSGGCLFLVSPPPRQPLRGKESRVPAAGLHAVVSEEVAALSRRAGRWHFVLLAVTPGLAYTMLGFVWFPEAHVTSGGVQSRPCITGQRRAPASQSTNLPVRVTSPVKKA